MLIHEDPNQLNDAVGASARSVSETMESDFPVSSCMEDSHLGDRSMRKPEDASCAAASSCSDTVTEPCETNDVFSSRDERRRQKLLRREDRQRKRELKEERRKRKLGSDASNVTPAEPFVFRMSSTSRENASAAQPGIQKPSSDLASTSPHREPIRLPSVFCSRDTPFTLPLAADAERSSSSSLLDFTHMMVLKKDHLFRPLIVCPTGLIYLEITSPVHKPAADFLATIAEPISRPENIHEFQITVFSLYAAVGVGMTIENIIRNLNKFSKNDIPDCLERLLRFHGDAFGRVKLVLRDNRYFLESNTREDLEYMLSHPVVAEARIRNSMVMRQVSAPPMGSSTGSHLREACDVGGNSAQLNAENDAGLESADAPTLDPAALGFKLSNEGAEKPLNETSAGRDQRVTAPVKQVFLFEVKGDLVGRVKETALTELKRPLVSEYDFRRDQKNPSLDMALKSTTKIRYYQERALRKMFSNGRARSGIIVLPCGAGKTLTGITATTTVRKSAMVLTSSSVAVDQWKRSFTDFTTIDPSLVITLTSDKKKDLPPGGAVLISTYTMMAYSGKRSVAAAQIINQIRAREWGLLIFDEVQFAPAPAFRKINDIVKSHCKLGLTATLVREDDLIHDLQWLIGPKLYEANWLELQEAGYLAKVQVSEVWCPMTTEFYREYLRSPHAKQRKLWVCNPNKLRVCEYLLRFHEARNDKIIVFSDNLFALKEVAYTLKKPFISGQVGMQERMVILNKFKTSPKLNTIFLSKVGDNAIDIPCANVVIQISFNFASRRQEAQRLGRILRPKAKGSETFNAFFYSLVSKDTQEMLYADKRQQFIIDQGYSYKVLPISVFPMEKEELIYDNIQRQQDMLVRIMSTNDQCMDIEDDEVILNDSGLDISSQTVAEPASSTYDSVRTVKTALSKLSGGAPRGDIMSRRLLYS